jgi:hypothetical protein
MHVEPFHLRFFFRDGRTATWQILKGDEGASFHNTTPEMISSGTKWNMIAYPLSTLARLRRCPSASVALRAVEAINPE